MGPQSPPPNPNSPLPVGRFTATQLCVVNALRSPGPQDTTRPGYNPRVRRHSSLSPADKHQRTSSLIANYDSAHFLPSILYLDCGVFTDSPHQRFILEPRRRIFFYWRNLAGVSLSILCLLVAYNSFFYVQSSLYGGLGTMALAVDYGAQVLSCLFVPAMLMRKIGSKWSLFVSMFCISLYIVANFYAVWWTLIPAAAVMGLGFAAMWATMNTLVSDLAAGYARLKGLKQATTVSRFFGLFYMTIETAKIWGNLISAGVLAPPTDHGLPPSLARGICGANYCNQPLNYKTPVTNGEVTGNQSMATTVVSSTVSWMMNISSTVAPESLSPGGTTQTQVFTLCGIALGIALFSLLLVAALLTSTKPTHVASGTALDKLLSTIRLLSNRNLQLLIIITVDVGLVQSFFVGDFTKAFLTCSLGIHKVGVVTTCYGVTTVLGSIGTGYLAQLVGRPTLVVGAVVLNLGDLLAMLLWTPNPDQMWVYYVMAGVWGIALSVWLTQLSALYARVFKDNHEDAFSNHRLWECIGFVIGFAWAQYLCMPIKIYISLVLLVLGLLGYIGVEINLRREKRKLREQHIVPHY